MSDATPVVEARGLSKRYGGFVAVDAVDFEVRPGEVLGLLGPNGAGKSTTMRMIYQVTPPSAGSLRIFGLRIEHTGRPGDPDLADEYAFDPFTSLEDL